MTPKCSNCGMRHTVCPYEVIGGPDFYREPEQSKEQLMDFEQTLRETIDELVSKLAEHGLVVQRSPYDELLAAHNTALEQAERAMRVAELESLQVEAFGLMDDHGQAWQVVGEDTIEARLAHLTSKNHE